MRCLALLFAAFGLLNLQAQTSASNLQVKNGQTVAFLGDSITGMGWGVPGGYMHLVTDGLAAMGVTITPIPAGVGGNRSVEMLARLDKDVLSKKPSWMLLSCGVNDVWSRTIDLPTFEKNITAIVDQAQAAGVQVMILTPTPIYEASKNDFNDKLGGYVAFMVQLAQARHLPLADENAAWWDYLKSQGAGPRTKNIITIDGVHPNPDGHQVLAKTILAAFGAKQDQIATAEKAWHAAPQDAAMLFDCGFRANVPLSAAETDALNKVAADQNVELKRLLNTIGIEAARDLLVAQPDLSKTYTGDLALKYAAAVKAKIDTLTNTPPGGQPTADTKPLPVNVGFRASASMSLDQYDTLKKVAAAQQLTLWRLGYTQFLETVRELLVARGDLSTTWTDDISSKTTPVLTSKLAALAAGSPLAPAGAAPATP